MPAVHANPGTAGTARGAGPARSNEWLDDAGANSGRSEAATARDADAERFTVRQADHSNPGRM